MKKFDEKNRLFTEYVINLIPNNDWLLITERMTEIFHQRIIFISRPFSNSRSIDQSMLNAITQLHFKLMLTLLGSAVPS